MFRLAAEIKYLFRPNPKPKGGLQFQQNRNSAKMAEIRPKAETESVSVVHYRIILSSKFYVIMILVEIINEGFKFFNTAMPKKENVINVSFPHMWHGTTPFFF